MNILQQIARWPWGLWRRQALAVARLDLRKCFLGKRLVVVYFLALLPPALMALRVTVHLLLGQPETLAETIQKFAVLYQAAFLRFSLFFGCVAIFTNIFRGEVMEKTLHYYLLTPIRRSVLVAGKFLAGLAAAAVFFELSFLASFVAAFVGLDGTALRHYAFGGAGAGHFLAYLGITLLACLGYGAVFTLTGTLFRNPVIPAFLFAGWESIHFLLPPLLKKFTVIHYLQGLFPVPLPQGPLAVLSAAPPLWLAGPGLVGFILAVLALAAWRTRRLEVTYSAD